MAQMQAGMVPLVELMLPIVVTFSAGTPHRAQDPHSEELTLGFAPKAGPATVTGLRPWAPPTDRSLMRPPCQGMHNTEATIQRFIST